VILLIRGLTVSFLLYLRLLQFTTDVCAGEGVNKISKGVENVKRMLGYVVVLINSLTDALT
jgi:hypothetical protein